MARWGVSEFNVVAYLATKGFHGKRGGTGEFSYPCFLGCGESAGSKKRKLYVNPDTGMYECKVCLDRGGPVLLTRFFGDDEEFAAGTTTGDRSKVLELASSIAHQMLLNNDRLLLYLMNERGLSELTILERRLGYIKSPWSLVQEAREAGCSALDLAASGLTYRDGPREGKDFFTNHLLIPYLLRGRVVQMRGRSLSEGGPRYMTGPGESARLFNEGALASEEIILVEGEFDAMVLHQALQASPEEGVRRYGVVGLPGVAALPDNFEGYFERVRRIYVAFDPDDAGVRAAAKVKDLFGLKARVVELEPEYGDWTDFFVKHGHTWRDAVTLIGEASGKRLFSMAESGVAFRKLRERGDGLRIGFTGVDAAIEPGVLPGQLFVFLAKTGTGKTLLLCNVAYHLRNEPTLFISLEQTREEVYERLERIFYFHNPLATHEELEAAYANIMICDENRLSEQDFSDLVEEFEIEHGKRPRVALLDYLGYYARGRPGGNQYEKVSDAVMQLKAEAKKHRLSVFAPHQVSRGVKEGEPIDLDDARDSGVIEETADFVLSFWSLDAGQQDAMTQPTGKLRSMLGKSRHGGKGKCFNFQMDLLTLAIVDDYTPAARQASHHTYLHWRGDTYQQLRAHQTQPRQVSIPGAAQPELEGATT